jgi:hypothetical protein
LDHYNDAIAILESSVLFVVGTILLGVAALVFARAFAEVQRGRAHRSSADAQEDTMRAASKAVDEIEEHRSREDYNPHIPSERELLDAMMMDGGITPPPSRNGHTPPKPGSAMYDPAQETTTMRNEQIEEEPPIPRDELYVSHEDPFTDV